MINKTAWRNGNTLYSVKEGEKWGVKVNLLENSISTFDCQNVVMDNPISVEHFAKALENVQVNIDSAV
jgi:hypothetical protein